MGKATVIPEAKTHIWLKDYVYQTTPERPSSVIKYAPEVYTIEAWSPVQQSSQVELRI